MRLSKLVSINLTILTLLFLFACKDDPSLTGLNLLPSGDRISVINDSITVSSFNVDTVVPIFKSSTVALGVYNDQFFGQMQASLLTEFGPSDTIQRDIGYKTVDSAFIYFEHDTNAYRGGARWKTNLRVFQLKDTLSNYVPYYSNMNLSDYVDTNSTPLTNAIVDFSSNLIKIPLQKDKFDIEKIINLDTAIINHPELFRKALMDMKIYGLYFLPGNTIGPGTVTSYGLNLVYSGHFLNSILVNYHTVKDTLVYEFGFSSNLKATHFYPSVNYVHHNYKGTRFFNEINGGKGDTLLYSDCSDGTKIRINFSGLRNLRNNDNNTEIDVGRADVNLPFVSSMYNRTTPITTSRMPIASRIILTVVDTGKIKYYSSRFKPYSDYFVNGTIDTVNKVCILNISQYVQEYLNRRTNIEDIYLEPIASDLLSSAIFRRGNSIKFRITYSKYKIK